MNSAIRTSSPTPIRMGGRDTHRIRQVAKSVTPQIVRPAHWLLDVVPGPSPQRCGPARQSHQPHTERPSGMTEPTTTSHSALPEEVKDNLTRVAVPYHEPARSRVAPPYRRRCRVVVGRRSSAIRSPVRPGDQCFTA